MRFDKDQKLAKLYLLFLLGIALVLILYTVVGFWLLPSIMKPMLEKNLAEKLHRKVSIESITMNPYELSFSMKGFAVEDSHSTGNWLAFDELYVVVQGGSLVERALILREVRLSGPYVNLIRMKNQNFNFSDLLGEEIPAPESTQGSAAGPDAKAVARPSADKPGKPQIFRFSIHNVQITNGTVDFYDELKDEKERIANINLDLPLISSLEKTEDGCVTLTVTAKINQSPLVVMAQAKPFSDRPESLVDIEVTDLDILDFLGYLPPQFKFKVRSGLVDAKARITYAQAEGVPALKINGRMSMKGFEAVDPNDSNLIKLPKLDVIVESLEPLAGKLHLSKVLFQSPRVDFWRNKDGTLNVQTLVAGSRAGEAGADDHKSESAFLISADDIEIAEGRIGFTDHAAESGFHTSLEAINLTINQFTNAPSSKAAIKFGARTDDNETLGTEGSLSLDPLSFQGTVGVSGIVAVKYAPYYGNQVLFDVRDGKLDAKASVHFESGGKNPEVKLSDLLATITSLKLRKSDEADNFLEIPSLQLKDGVLDLTRKELTLGEVTARDGKIAAIRDNNGEMNLQKLIPASPEPATEERVVQGSIETEQSPWKFLLKEVSLKDNAVRFEDRMISEPATFLVDQINLDGRNISAEKENNTQITLSCRVNEGGTVQMEGNLNVTPLFADLKLNLKDIGIPPVQPYLPQDIKVKLTAGNLSADGKLLLGASQEGSLTASYVGDVLLSDFSSLDTIGGEDFLGWKSLEIRGLDAGSNPIRASIKRMEMKDFFSRVVISPEGNINILQILGTAGEAGPGPADESERGPKAGNKAISKGEGAPAKPAVAPQPKPQTVVSERKTEQPAAISIDQIVLQGGEIAFSDNHIKPNFHAEMLDVSGTISGLASQKDRLADVKLRGKLYRSSPFEITGKIRPFPDDLSADLSVNFKNIDMTRWNPYARRYVGYTLEKGNLQLELKYVIVKKKLDSQNNIVFDRLTLGDKVDSPDATTLPVKFALALMEDRNGQIQLGIPVTGNLDDPQFSLGQIIMGAIKNFLMKAVTAPFALLGALLPHGVGEIDHVDLDNTTGKITDASKKKLDAMAKVLDDRPNLELDIQGYLESQSGKEILTQQLFMKKLKTQKLKEIMKKGASAISIDQVTVGTDEFQRYLEMAYDEEFPKKGLAKIEFFKKTPPEEMKTQLLSKIQATDEDLRSLAYDWALTVKDYLVESGKVESRRLFLLEPIIGGLAEGTKAKENGVNLKLK